MFRGFQAIDDGDNRVTSNRGISLEIWKQRVRWKAWNVIEYTLYRYAWVQGIGLLREA